MSRASVTKGKEGERELANIVQEKLREGYGLTIKVQRNLEQPRVEGGFDLDGLPYMAIEVKRREKLSIATWWRQTTKQAAPHNLIPVLAYRQSRKPWVFVIPLSVMASGWYDESWDYYGDKELMTMEIDGFVRMCADNLRYFAEVQQAENKITHEQRKRMN